VTSLELKTAEELNLELDDMAEVTSVSTATLLEHHRTRVGAIEEAPLLLAGHPLTDFLTVYVIRIFLVEGRLSEVNDLAVFFAKLILQLLTDCGFADPIGTGHDDELACHALWCL
jgi:hypothetical protein